MGNMKKLTVLILLTLISGFVFSQPGNKNLYVPEEGKNKNNFFEIQKEFNRYWDDFNLDKGYYYKDGKKYKAAGWKQFKRWEWYWETRVDRKTGEFPQVNIFKVNKEFKSKLKTKTDQSNWQNMGPNSSLGGYAGIGRINCIAFHPTNNNTFWIGAPSGGLWKTTDGGNNWEVLTDTLPVIGVSEIIVPNDYEISKTIYIATGDRDGGDNYSIGVLKTTDDGETWVETGLSFNVSSRYRITRMLIHPTEQNIMYAATNGGIFKTIDSGDTWSSIQSGLFFDLEFKYGSEDNVLYAATYAYSGTPEIYKTTDAGNNWNVVHTFPSSAVRVELDPAQSDPEYVYALVSTQAGGLEGIYKSNDSGDSFSKVYDGTISGNNLLNWHQSLGDMDTGGQGSYDLTLSVSPTDTSHLFLGGINTWESEDGGETWELNNHWYGGFGATEVHADKHYMEYQSPSVFFEANDGGIYKTTDGGNTWTDLTDGLVISQMYKLGVSQTNKDEVITGLQDNGSKLTYSGSWKDVKGGDGMECIIDYEDVNIQYATYVYGQIDRTMDHWAGWWTVVDITDTSRLEGGPNGAWVTPYLIDPFDNETLYLGYEDVWKTTNRGDSWSKISNLELTNKIRSMAIAPSDNNTLYITDFDNFYKTTDGGNTWTDLTSNLPSTSNAITYISVDAFDSKRLWITYGGYNGVKAFESTDGGLNWTDISSGLPSVPANTIIENKFASTQQLYAGTDIGVFIKEGDTDWTLFSNDLPSVIVTELEIYYDESTPSNSVLYASTYGRGLWKSDLASFEIEDIYLHAVQSPVYVSDDSSAIVDISFNIYDSFSSNTFTAYLSNGSGDFTNEISIGELESDVSGTINGVIPAATPTGSGYKIRIMSSNPVSESTLSNSLSIILDNEAPTVEISSSESGTTSSDPFPVTITFNEVVNDFVQSEVVVNNGTVSSFQNVNSSEYAIEISPSASGVVTVDVPAGVAKDIVGHENTAATQWTIEYYPTNIELLEKYGIKIYPNPSNGKFNMELEQANNINISVVDMSGRIVYNKDLVNESFMEMDLSDFKKGIYILKLNIDNQEVTSKIVIQ